MYEREESPPFRTRNVKRAKDGGLHQKVQEQVEEQGGGGGGGGGGQEELGGVA
jgi:hypothetical protein